MPVRLRLLLIPQRTVPPSSGLPPLYCQPSAARPPVVRDVTDGLKSSTRPRRRSLRPTSFPDWARNEALARRAGAQESSYPEC